jgi:hypothetical protein
MFKSAYSESDEGERRRRQADLGAHLLFRADNALKRLEAALSIVPGGYKKSKNSIVSEVRR